MSLQEVLVPAQIPQGQAACYLCAVRALTVHRNLPSSAPLEPLICPQGPEPARDGLQGYRDRAILQPPCVWRTGLARGPRWLLSGWTALEGPVECERRSSLVGQAWRDIGAFAV